MRPLMRPCSARTFLLVSATLIVLARAELSPLDQACFDGECRHANAGFVLPSWSPDRLSPKQERIRAPAATRAPCLSRSTSLNAHWAFFALR
jgi:hypothetical protein